MLSDYLPHRGRVKLMVVDAIGAWVVVPKRSAQRASSNVEAKPLDNRIEILLHGLDTTNKIDNLLTALASQVMNLIGKVLV